MSRPHRPPDAEIEFKLTEPTPEGTVKRVLSGYRPTYEIKPDYWTSTHHEFAKVGGVTAGEVSFAEVWFISPEAYPNSLWIGRIITVGEGVRPVGTAKVVCVFNQALLRNDA